MPTEAFEARVRELVDQGKLTAEEARGLLGAEAAPPTLEVAAEVAPARVSIELTHGAVSVRGRAGLAQPRLVRASDAVSLTATAAGWTVQHRPVRDIGSALDWVRAGLSSISSANVELEVPADLPLLEVRTVAGDVEVEDVAGNVRVNVTAGDVDLDGVSGFDVTARTGSVRVRGRIQLGEHRIQLYTGDAELVLEPGSSAELELSTVMGRLDARDLELRRAAGLARAHEATVGAGDARIAIATVTGDVDVRAGKER